MPLLTTLCIASLVLAAANVVHWRLRGGRWLLWPGGVPGWIINALFFANLLASVLILAHVVSDGVLWSVSIAYLLTINAYSLWRRHARGGKIGTSGVA